MEKMNEVEDDMTMAAFLQQYFSGDKYETLRQAATRFAEGFDLADTTKASVLSLRAEWMEEPDRQYRITGGFDQLVDWLEKQCKSEGGVIHVSSPVEKIKWAQNEVAVVTADGREFIGHKTIITIPLGILQAAPSLLFFEPAIQHYADAAKKIGFGPVVKILLQFKENFWTKKKTNLGFVLSGEKIPTWWTQLPSDDPLLTGWAGGPQAKELVTADDKTILQFALQSLSAIFEQPVAELKRLLTASFIANWNRDIWTRGGYSYDTPESKQARELLSTPILNTLFFAGEALYEGASPGTVEAALVSGKLVAEKINAGL
jgi:monoamine oxidase